MIEIARRHTARYDFMYLSSLNRLKISVEEHEGIIKALSIKDIEKAENFMRKHIEDGGKKLCDDMRKNNVGEK